MPKHGLLDELLGDMAETGNYLAKRQCPSPRPAPVVKRESPSFDEDNGLVYRTDDRTVTGACLSATSLTHDIPKPTPVYSILKKMCEEGEHVLPFELYWLKNSKLVTLDLNLPVHMLALYMVEAHRKNRGMDRLIRPFSHLAGRFNTAKGSGRVKGKQIKDMYMTMKKTLYPDIEGTKSTVGDRVDFYVREILSTEPFYENIVYELKDRKKAVKVIHCCKETALWMIAKRPPTVSTCDHTIVRHAIQKVVEGNKLGDFQYKPAKPGKNEAWLF